MQSLKIDFHSFYFLGFLNCLFDFKNFTIFYSIFISKNQDNFDLIKIKDV